MEHIRLHHCRDAVHRAISPAPQITSGLSIFRICASLSALAPFAENHSLGSHNTDCGGVAHDSVLYPVVHDCPGLDDVSACDVDLHLWSILHTGHSRHRRRVTEIQQRSKHTRSPRLIKFTILVWQSASILSD